MYMGTITGTTTPGPSGSGSNGNVEALHETPLKDLISSKCILSDSFDIQDNLLDYETK